MPNVLHKTEAFDDAYWSPSGLTVSANTHGAPAFAGGSAGLADTLTDGSAGTAGLLINTGETIPGDTTDWVLSLYVRKDADTSRMALFGLALYGGTPIYTNLWINTMTAAFDDDGSATAPDASGVIDVDANWWRFWFRRANNGTNVAAQAYIYPAYATTLGGGEDATLTGNLIVWGIQLENASVVSDYIPDPYYAFAAVGSDLPFVTTVDAQRI